MKTWTAGFFSNDPWIDPGIYKYLLAADITGDRNLEIMVFQNHLESGVFQNDGCSFKPQKIFFEKPLSLLVDFENDDHFEYGFPDSSIKKFYIYDHNEKLAATISSEHHLYLGTQVFLVDFENTGIKQWVFVEILPAPGQECYPLHSIACQDMEGNFLWRTIRYPNLIIQAIADLNCDGRKELICGTRSEEHGIIVDGLEERGHGYILVFDEHGQLEWKSAFTGWFAQLQDSIISDQEYIEVMKKRETTPGKGLFINMQAAVSDVNGDGRPEVIAAGGSWLKSWGKLAILQGNDGMKLFEYPQKGYMPFSLTTLGIADVDGDGKVEIVCGATDGKIRIFDNQCNLKASYFTSPSTIQWDHCITNVWALNDINGDGINEIIASGTTEREVWKDPRYRFSNFSDHYLFVLSYHPESQSIEENLKIQLEEKCQSAIVIDLIPGGANEIAVLTDEIEIYSLYEDAE